MKRKTRRTVEDFMSTAVISMKETDSISHVRLDMDLALAAHQRHHARHVAGRDVRRQRMMQARQTIPGKPVRHDQPFKDRTRYACVNCSSRFNAPVQPPVWPMLADSDQNRS